MSKDLSLAQTEGASGEPAGESNAEHELGQPERAVLARIVLTLIGGVLVLNGFLARELSIYAANVAEVSAAIGALILAAPIVARAVRNLAADKLDLDELIALAIVAAIAFEDFVTAGAGDYVALLAYLDRNEDNEAELQKIRGKLVEKTGVATCLGFGPRFLHSTGQAYKGGPNTGVFLQITADPPVDFAVPGKRYSFGTVEAAQARGDFQVLVERGRRALRVHLTDQSDDALADLVKVAVRAI